eukprot:529796-Rhodomonas_salina.2
MSHGLPFGIPDNSRQHISSRIGSKLPSAHFAQSATHLGHPALAHCVSTYHTHSNCHWYCLSVEHAGATWTGQKNDMHDRNWRAIISTRAVPANQSGSWISGTPGPGTGVPLVHGYPGASAGPGCTSHPFGIAEWWQHSLCLCCTSESHTCSAMPSNPDFKLSSMCDVYLSRTTTSESPELELAQIGLSKEHS